MKFKIGDNGLVKNEKTGLWDIKKVLHTMNSMTLIRLTLLSLIVMDIVSRLYQIAYIHTFQVYGNDISPAKPSIGKEYHGDIKNAYWINAGDLKKVIKCLAQW